jgi:glycosyltransferase involved in cell wall biosynthesis
VDDFGEWPGLDRKAMNRLEKIVVAKADALIAVSETLRTRLAGMGRESHSLTHGVDVGFWRHGDSMPELDHLERPLFLFWGVIDRRMDTAFLERLAQDMTQGTIVLAGPEQNADPRLAKLPRIHRTGALRFEQLPGLAHAASVLIMPYVDEPVTRAMQPLKLKEYLATGKPVVVRDLPANREWADALDLVARPEQFSSAVRERSQSGLPADQAAARGRLSSESWDAKAAEFARVAFAP